VGITSAVELPEAQRKALVDAIGKRLSRAVQVQWSVDAELIAGAVIRAGDTVIDGSAQGELRRLQTALSQ
jgi:F-type H+-transporting ATPase subunit delta